LSWEFKSLESIIPSFVASPIYPIDNSHLAPERLLHFLSLALLISRLTPPNWEGPISPLLTAMIRCGGVRKGHHAGGGQLRRHRHHGGIGDIADVRIQA